MYPNAGRKTQLLTVGLQRVGKTQLLTVGLLRVGKTQLLTVGLLRVGKTQLLTVGLLRVGRTVRQRRTVPWTVRIFVDYRSPFTLVFQFLSQLPRLTKAKQ